MKLKNKILFFISIISLLAGGLLPEKVYAESTSIQYEQDGRVKPIGISEAESLTEPQLDEMLEAIGIDNKAIKEIDKEKKIKIASEEGVIYVFNIYSQCRYSYYSDLGNRILYKFNIYNRKN